MRGSGPAKDVARIPFLDHKVVEGDFARVGSLAAKVIETPGHTLGHVAYYFADGETAFCGDTLFSLGCGRVFETPYPVHVELAGQARRPARRDQDLLRA